MVNFLEVDKRVGTCSPRGSHLKRCSLRDLLAVPDWSSWVLTTPIASLVVFQINWSAGHVPIGQEKL